MWQSRAAGRGRASAKKRWRSKNLSPVATNASGRRPNDWVLADEDEPSAERERLRPHGARGDLRVQRSAQKGARTVPVGRRRRIRYYGCVTRRLRGPSVCANTVVVPVES